MCISLDRRNRSLNRLSAITGSNRFPILDRVVAHTKSPCAGFIGKPTLRAAGCHGKRGNYLRRKPSGWVSS
jgi:hypothetical protein